MKIQITYLIIQLMFHIASTRFNNITWKENSEYRKKNKVKGAIYGAAIKIHEKYPLGSLLFIAEMNNDTNQIEGISLIRNRVVLNKRHFIYEDDNYNRYIYSGQYWLNRSEIEHHNHRLLSMIETMLFKGKSHLKRQSGISVITKKLYNRWNFDETWMKENIKELFIEKCKP